MNSVSKRNLIKLLKCKQGTDCCYCGVGMIDFRIHGTPRDQVPPNALTLEHLCRVTDGGRNCHDNLALACISCNEGRGSVDWFTYKSYRMGELSYL